MTPQRQVIFRLLHGNDEHPTVEALYEAARAEMPTISLKTVYQTVHDLEDDGRGARCSTSAPAACASTRTSSTRTTT